MLKVYYPHGGKHFLLHWWTYNDRGHVVLSRTEGGVRSTATKVFDKHLDAEIKDYLEIEIVGPSALQHAQAKAVMLQDSIDTFHREILYRMKDVVKVGRALPKQFEVCTSYDPEDGVDRDKWAEQCHYECRNCFETIKTPDMTKAELYDKYSEEWYKLYPPKQWADKKLVLSQAEAAKDDEELYFADAAFGHHSSGIALNKVEVSTSGHPRYLTSALFFYRKIRSLDSKEFHSALEQRKKMMEEFKKNQERVRVAKRKQDELAKIEATLTFFKEN